MLRRFYFLPGHAHTLLTKKTNFFFFFAKKKKKFKKKGQILETPLTAQKRFELEAHPILWTKNSKVKGFGLGLGFGFGQGS